jgi:hypothetical protein
VTEQFADTVVHVYYLTIADEGVYVDTYGKIIKNVVLQWGELPTSVGEYVCNVKILLHLRNLITGFANLIDGET